MSDTARTAYLFQCTGANIPRSPCTQGWTFVEQFELRLRARVPAPIMAEPMLKGIADYGYYVWRGGSGPSKRPHANIIR